MWTFAARQTTSVCSWLPNKAKCHNNDFSILWFLNYSITFESKCRIEGPLGPGGEWDIAAQHTKQTGAGKLTCRFSADRFSPSTDIKILQQKSCKAELGHSCHTWNWVCQICSSEKQLQSLRCTPSPQPVGKSPSQQQITCIGPTRLTNRNKRETLAIRQETRESIVEHKDQD